MTCNYSIKNSVVMDNLLQQKMIQFVEQTRDGYCILSKEDRIVYCNQSFADTMMISYDDALGMHFETILEKSFNEKRGINIEANVFEDFLTYTRKVRRSRDYRIFEVDFTDGRWFLFSEQLNDAGELFIHIKDMTKQKVLENDLRTSVSNLRKLSLTDELTGVANRRALVDSVDMELSRCRRSGASMSLLIMDLDFFKHVNDTYGHPTGDAALVHVTKIFSQSLRQYDILGRIGGEEFVVFLSNTTVEKSLEIAERIRILIADTVFTHQGQEVPLTISIGHTTLGCNAEFDDLYSQADQALYHAKSTGRNKVVSFLECAEEIS